MFCGIDFMAIWFYLKESVLILLVSILTSTFSTDFSKVLPKVKFDPENSPALNEFLEQLLINHEHLEWVDKLTQTFKEIGSLNSGLEIRKNIFKRNDHRYRNRRKLRPYYTNSRNYKNKISNAEDISHLNIEDYENALSGVLKKNGYKQQRVKQKRNIVETPLPTTNYKNHAVLDLLDSRIIDISNKDNIDNYQTLYNKQKEMKNILKKSAKERFINYGLSTTVNVKPEELEELMKVVEPVAKSDSNEKNREKNKTLGIMNSKKTELTITKSSHTRQKNDVSSNNELETTLSPLIVIVMESAPTDKTLIKKSITTPATNQAKPADMTSKKAKIKTHLEKNIFFDNPNIEQQIDASPTDANVKSINLDNMSIMTDPYILHFTETTTNKLEKRQNIIEVDPAKVMSPEEIRRAKIEAKKLLDVDKDFNERNEPDFNKELMTSKNYDYKDIDDYWDLKNKNNQKHRNTRNQNEDNILESEEKREIKNNEMQQNSFFSRQLLNYDYEDNYQNKLYSDYDDGENSLRRYPREVDQNYLFPNEGDDYFDRSNEQPFEKRFYNRRWKKDANDKNYEKGLFNKNALKKKINKLKNFFGIGHENNYNENVEDDYPVANMAIEDYIAKNKDLIEDNILKTLSEKPEDIIQDINDTHDTQYVDTKKSFHQQNNVYQNTHSSLARKTFQTQADNNFNIPDLNSEREKTTNNNSSELNSKISQKSLQQTTPKGIQKNTQTKQNTKPNSMQNNWNNNFAINSIIGTKFPNDIKPNTKTTNLHDFSTKQLDTSTTTFNPLSFSFDYKINLLDDSSSSTEKIVNLKGKRESHAIKNLLTNYKTNQIAAIIPKDTTTVTLFAKDVTKYSEGDKIYKDKKKMFNKNKLRNLPKYRSYLYEMLNSQKPSAEVHVDELKLNAIKQNQEKNKKIQTRESLPDCRAVKIYDLDDEDYIPSDYENIKSSNSMAFDGKELKHSNLLVKHSAEKNKDSSKCKTKKVKSQKHRCGKTKEEQAMKTPAHKKIKDNGINYAHGHVSSEDEEDDENSNKTTRNETISCSDTTKDQTSNCTTTSKNKKTTITPTTTTTCSTTCKATSDSTTSTPTPCPTSTTTCQTTSPTTTTCKTTTPTTSKSKTTCTTTTPTTSTCKTTCPTTSTCAKTTSPTTTTCKTTAHPTTKTTTCKTTTCPTTKTTTCKTTTCPTTKTTQTTTCKTTTCPTTKTTTCKTTTCPTVFTSTKICPSITKSTPCETSCPASHSTHKFGIKFAPEGFKNKNIFDRSKRKFIYNSQYFDNKSRKAKFNPYRVSRHVVYPKKKILYNNMPKNEYQGMKRKNFIRRLKRKYFPRPNKNLPETSENNLIRRKKSISADKDLTRLINIPVYKVYPKMIKHQRYKRKKLKTDDDNAEDAKQRKVLETIYHHRITRRKNEPEYVSKSQSDDYTENNVDLPSSYNAEVKRNLIRRTTMDNSNNSNLKETIPSDSRSDAVIGKIPAKVVQDLYLDLSNSKDVKKNLGKILRSPQHDPKNPFTPINKLPITHREVTNLLSMYSKLPEAEKKRNKYMYNYLHTQKLFLERMMREIKKYYRQQRKRILRRKQNFYQSQHHVVWVPNESSDSSENTNYIKLQKRMIGDDQRDYFKNRIKRENYFRNVMRTRRNPTSYSKLDEWMKVLDEGYKPLYINFTF